MVIMTETVGPSSPREDPRITNDVLCAGCGRSFSGDRGLKSHQSRPYQTLACRPQPKQIGE